MSHSWRTHTQFHFTTFEINLLFFSSMLNESIFDSYQQIIAILSLHNLLAHENTQMTEAEFEFTHTYTL